VSSVRSAGSRRRGAALEAEILDAGWDQLIETGYERFTIEAVAERSSAARSVLYRRWPSRLELLEAVVRRHSGNDIVPTPDTGTLRGDLVAVLSEFNRRRHRIVGYLAVQLGVHFDDTGLSAAEVQRWFRPQRPIGMELLIARAVERGELKAMPPPRIAALPIDLFRNELVLTMKAVPSRTIAEIVDDVFLPLAMNFGKRQG
jgi:AcrR family transcriptional regulator